MVRYDIDLHNPLLYLGVGPVLVEHDTLSYGRVLHHTAGNLLILGVPVDVDLLLVSIGPGDRLSSILQVDPGGDGVLEEDSCILEGRPVGLDDGGGVYLLLEELVRRSQHLGGQHDARGDTVPDLLVLSPGDCGYRFGLRPQSLGHLHLRSPASEHQGGKKR